MADFFQIHRRLIERAVCSGGANEYFQIPAREPLNDDPAANETAMFVAFRRLPEGKYEPAGIADRAIIDDWNTRHRFADASLWDLPKFGTRG
jgi:hypothetical protein